MSTQRHSQEIIAQRVRTEFLAANGNQNFDHDWTIDTALRRGQAYCLGVIRPLREHFRAGQNDEQFPPNRTTVAELITFLFENQFRETRRS